MAKNNYIIMNADEAPVVADTLAAAICEMRTEQPGGLAHGPVLVLQAVLLRIADAFNIELPADPQGGVDCPDDCDEYGSDTCNGCAADPDQKGGVYNVY